MTGHNPEQVQAFAQKMQTEGTAGFAAGLKPWDSWDDFEERVGSRVWQGTVEQVAEPEDPARSFGDRLLATITAVALATLIIGIAGVFLTKQSTSQATETKLLAASGSLMKTTTIALPAKKDTLFNVTPTQPAKNKLPATTATVIPVAAPAAEQSGSTDNNTHTPVRDANSQLAFVTSENQPAPAAGTAPDSASEPTVKSVAIKQSGEPGEHKAKPVNTTPVQLADISMLDVHTKLQKAAPPDTKPNEKAGKNGAWSINIASYLQNSTAKQMRQQFLDKGVSTDMVTAIVNGKTYYRLRVTGFDSRQNAMAESRIIKQKLGLKEAWITRK